MFKDEKPSFYLLILTGNPVFRYQKPNGINGTPYLLPCAVFHYGFCQDSLNANSKTQQTTISGGF